MTPKPEEQAANREPRHINETIDGDTIENAWQNLIQKHETLGTWWTHPKHKIDDTGGQFIRVFTQDEIDAQLHIKHYPHTPGHPLYIGAIKPGALINPQTYTTLIEASNLNSPPGEATPIVRQAMQTTARTQPAGLIPIYAQVTLEVTYKQPVHKGKCDPTGWAIWGSAAQEPANRTQQ